MLREGWSWVTDRGNTRSPSRTRGAVVALVVAAALAAAVSARAGDVRVVVDVRPGHLTLGAATDVSSTADRSRGLDRIVVAVTDARGSGAGWRLDVRATGAVAVAALDMRCGARSTCTLPQNLVGAPGTLAPGRLTTVLDARKGTGMGRIEVTLTVAAGSTGGMEALGVSLRPG